MATYTTQDQIDLSRLHSLYGVEDPLLRPLDGGAANSSFHLYCGAGEFTLTILDNHDGESARRLATHTSALSRLGVPTTEVVPARDGSLAPDLGGRPVMLKKWVEGKVQVPLALSSVPEAGGILARLHALEPQVPGFEEVPSGTRRLSDAHLAAIEDFKDSEFAEWLMTRLRQVRIAESGRHPRRALTHGDLFADNVVVRGDGSLSFLDWETLSLDDPLLDIGMAAVGLAQDNGVLQPDRLNALVTGYGKLSPLSDEERALLPVEIEHAALIIAFHRYYRHRVRFPDPAKRDIHLGMVQFADSVPEAARAAKSLRAAELWG